MIVKLGHKNLKNTPGTAGGPGGRDRTLAVAKNLAKMTFFFWGGKKLPNKNIFFLHISLVDIEYWFVF